MSPVDVLKRAADHGLTLRINGEKLRVLPAERLSPDFAEVLKAHKPALLALLKLPFVMVYSETLEETLFFARTRPPKPRWSKPAQTPGASTPRTSCARSASKTASRRFLPPSYARCMRSNAPSRGRISS